MNLSKIEKLIKKIVKERMKYIASRNPMQRLPSDIPSRKLVRYYRELSELMILMRHKVNQIEMRYSQLESPEILK